MDDATIHERIEKLVNEEHELWQREPRATATMRPQRLAEVKVPSTRRGTCSGSARRSSRTWPDVAVERDPSVVENYRSSSP